MVTKEKKIIKELPVFYGQPQFQVYELGDNDVMLRGSRYYVITTAGDMEESVLDLPIIYGPEIQDTVEIRGSGTRHLRAAEPGPLDVVIEKEIDVDRLIKAIDATDEEVNGWLALILEDYDVDSTEDNVEAISRFIRWWLEEEALKRGLKLEEDESLKLFRFAVRLAYEALYVGYA